MLPIPGPQRSLCWLLPGISGILSLSLRVSGASEGVWSWRGSCHRPWQASTCTHVDFRSGFFLCVLFLWPPGGQRAGLLEEPGTSPSFHSPTRLFASLFTSWRAPWGFIFHSCYVSLFVSKLLPESPFHPSGSGPLDAAGLSCSSEVSCLPPPGSAAVYPAVGSPLTWSHDTTGGNLCGVCHFSSGLCLRTRPSGSPTSLVAQQARQVMGT